MKKLIIAAVVALTSFGASAECWVVGDLKGTSYAERNAYEPELDEFSGNFNITISGKTASVKYSGTDSGGVEYSPMSASTVVGVGGDGQGQRTVDTWSILPSGTVTLAKTISGYGPFDSVKAFVGKVKGKC